jgi:hypothetical protein
LKKIEKIIINTILSKVVYGGRVAPCKKTEIPKQNVMAVGLPHEKNRNTQTE